MTGPRIGSLFSGYRGLDMAVEAVTGGRTVWVSDIDKGANAILAHHAPGVPNLGDISAVDFAAVENVEVLTGGFPCQDVSLAGKRGGLARYGDRNRSGLWAVMACAIDVLRPQLVVAENVRGLLSARTDSDADLFDCLACMADADAEPMRALGAVLGDLAALGYDAAWHLVRASDVGAPHQRARVFVVAWPSDTDGPRLEVDRPVSGESAHVRSVGRDAHPGGVSLFPTPTVSDTNGAGRHGDGGLDLRTAVALLPTPGVADATGGHATRSGARSNELLLPGLAKTFVTLPTPRANQSGSDGAAVRPSLDTLGQSVDWGKFEPAIRQWEAITRPAPQPTEQGARGGQRLAPRFVEWMMGLPDGHVTDPAIGLTRNEQLKALGNGVVPQQAEHALRTLFAAVGAA